MLGACGSTRRWPNPAPRPHPPCGALRRTVVARLNRADFVGHRWPGRVATLCDFGSLPVSVPTLRRSNPPEVVSRLIFVPMWMTVTGSRQGPSETGVDDVLEVGLSTRHNLEYLCLNSATLIAGSRQSSSRPRWGSGARLSCIEPPKKSLLRIELANLGTSPLPCR